MLFGSHMSAAGGPSRAIERARDAGCDSLQIFVKNNMQWAGQPFASAEVARFKELWRETGIGPIFGHTGYLINIAAPASPNRDRSLESLAQEIQFAAQLGLPFLVLHPGAHLGAGESSGLAQAVAGLDEVFAVTARLKVRIALEITAGQGTCLGSKVEHLAAILDRSAHPRRLGICLDTAHLFAAGYPIHNPRGWRDLIRQVEKMIGLDQILAFHLNDSKTAFGSRVDRHAHIGEGQIGREGFRHIVRDKRFASVPGCLETPKSAGLQEDVKNLAVLRELAAGK
jgi:deoxyribonuclease-4